MEQESEEYPVEIMPRVGYKRRLNMDSLLKKYPSLMVVRLVEGFVNDYFTTSKDEEKTISDKVFRNSMANLSLNLAGGLFDVSPNGHLRFLPSGSIVKVWEGGEIEKIQWQKDINYHVYDNCFGVCFMVSRIHNRTFPFYKHFDSKEERDAYAREVDNIAYDGNMIEDAAFVGAFKSKKESVRVNPRIRVHHSPTNANYWHMTLDTYRPKDETYINPEDKQDSSDRKMFKALKQDLVQCCTINGTPTYQLNAEDYYK